MKMVWILGWAVPEGWFAPFAVRTFPAAEHTFIAAGPDTLVQLEALPACDWLVGYSLGAQVLLSAAARGLSFRRVSLLAPIFAFAREENLGGRVDRTKVRYLVRWLRNDPVAALTDFYARAGLDVPAELVPSTATAELLWGLAHLEAVRIEPPPPRDWRLWCGTADSLLDAASLSEIVPGIRQVNGTHHPAALLQAMAEGER
jgi:pimeloyl-ACP methyl ester carboxylesterase